MKEEKEMKGPMDFLIQDAIANINTNGDEQKPVNIKTSLEKSFNEKLTNAQKFEIGFGLFEDKKAEVGGFKRDNSEVENDSVEGDDSGALDSGVYGADIVKRENKDNVNGSYGSNEDSDNSIDNLDSIKWFSELNNKDVQSAGGKGASLGEMFNNKFPVPPGFVITAQAFGKFIKDAGLKEKIHDILNELDVDDTEELTKASKEIRKLIEAQNISNELKSEILESYHILGTEKIDELGISEDALTILKNAQEPAFVSVRSSATAEDLVDASFAGQQESFLNVKGEGQLIEKVKKCFSSLYTPRAIYYRKKKGFEEKGVLLAAVVQKMVDSEKSGVVFSKDPVNLDDNVAIEAVFGLGEGIVGGKIKPDHYLVSRELKIEEGKVADKKIAIVRTGSGENETIKLSPEKSKTQVLTNAEVLEIADYAIKLEEHYKKPQDIEFAIEGKEIYILQSRPITTLGGEKQKGKILSGNVLLEGSGASPGIGVGVVRIIKSMEDLSKIKKGEVLVTEMTNPDMVVAMQRSAAIVTDEGGMTSHAAIVSREMGIPAIVGTGEATSVLKDGMKITIDGFNGKVYEGEVAEASVAEIKKAVETNRIKLKVILDLPDFASRAAESGLDSVGLLRLEGIIASNGKHPLLYKKEKKLEEYSKILAKGLEKIAGYFNLVWIRASDIRTDEFSSLKGAPEREINPMLGFHGIRFSLKYPEILKAELNAIKEVASANPDKKFGVMFPQVISIEEVKEAKKYFNEVKTSNMDFGVMIETPAAVQIIEDIADEVDFVSFGTNDLTQFSLGVDRGNEDVQYLYNELHPAIFFQIKRVISICRRKKVETSICGQAGSKKEMVEFLFRKGINSISVNADAAYDISVLIKSLEDEWTKKKEEEMKEIERFKEEEKRKREEEMKEIERVKEEEKKEIERLKEEEEENERKEKERLRNEERLRKEEEEKEKKLNKTNENINQDRERYGESRDDREKKEYPRDRDDDRRERQDGFRDNDERSVDRDNSNKERERQDGFRDNDRRGVDKKRRFENQDEKKELKRKKKWEKFKKWKKLKKERRENQIKNENENQEREESKKEDGENKDWGKKAELGFESNEDRKDKEENKEIKYQGNNNQEVRKRDEERVEERKEQNKNEQDNSEYLNKEKIEISAERQGIDVEEFKENIGTIEPMGSLERIEDKAEEIQEQVKEDNLERVEENKRIEDNIEVSGERVDEDSENISRDIDDKEIKENDSEESGGEDDVRESEGSGREEDVESEEEIINNDNEKSEEEVSSNSNQFEEKTSSNTETFEDIGVYNPDEDSDKEDKHKYKYDFEDYGF